MTAKLVEQKQGLNIALLKVIEKDGAIGRLSEQRQSKCRALALSPPSPRTRHNLSFYSSFRCQDRAGVVTDGLGTGRDRPEPGPGCLAQVGGYLPEGHQGPSQAWKGDEHDYGSAQRITWASDA
jgi:hypothetical protein